MNPAPSSGDRKGKGPGNSEEEFQINPKSFMYLYPSYRQAEAIKARIERTVSELPYLAAQVEEYLTQEMTNVTDAYFDGICSEDPAGAQRYIKEARARMEAFHNDLGNRMRSHPRRRWAVIEPGPPPPLIPPANNAAIQTGESSAMGARRNEQPRSLGVLPGEPENDPAEHGLMHPGKRVMARPAPPVRRVTFGDTTVIPDSPTGPPMSRSLTIGSIARALRRSPGESKREKVKDLWKRVRDRLKKEDPSA